ncbi:MAG TPA: hypothetical protein VK308_09830, partial [Pyrinomonadaceae bacterium]|nr:hypothetical protein [Pyrinomonadaceae bacterium]
EKLTAGHGRALLMVNDADSQRQLAGKVIELSLSVRETEKAIKRIGKEDPNSEAKKNIKPKVDANVKAAETKLRRWLGTQVNIMPDGKGTGGKIEIEYYSDSDLDRIYSLIQDKK